MLGCWAASTFKVEFPSCPLFLVRDFLVLVVGPRSVLEVKYSSSRCLFPCFCFAPLGVGCWIVGRVHVQARFLSSSPLSREATLLCVALSVPLSAFFLLFVFCGPVIPYNVLLVIVVCSRELLTGGLA